MCTAPPSLAECATNCRKTTPTPRVNHWTTPLKWQCLKLIWSLWGKMKCTSLCILMAPNEAFKMTELLCFGDDNWEIKLVPASRRLSSGGDNYINVLVQNRKQSQFPLRSFWCEGFSCCKAVDGCLYFTAEGFDLQPVEEMLLIIWISPWCLLLSQDRR